MGVVSMVAASHSAPSNDWKVNRRWADHRVKRESRSTSTRGFLFYNEVILKTRASLCLRITHCGGARPVQTGSVHVFSCSFRIGASTRYSWSVHLHFSESTTEQEKKNPVPGFLSDDWHYNGDRIIPGPVFVYFRWCQSSHHCSDWRVSAFEKILFRTARPDFPFHLFSIFPNAFYFSVFGTNVLMEYILWFLSWYFSNTTMSSDKHTPLPVIVCSFFSFSDGLKCSFLLTFCFSGI